MVSDSKQRRNGERAAAAQARRDLGEIRWIRNWVLYPCALTCFVGLALVSTAVGSGSQSREEEVIVLAAMGLATAVVLGAILIVERRPVPVTLCLALIYTPMVIYGLYAHLVGEETRWSWWRYLWYAFWALYFWSAFFGALRISQRARAEPDSFLAQIMRGAGPQESSGHRAQSLERHRRFKARERRVVLFLYVVLVAFLVYGGSRFG